MEEEFKRLNRELMYHGTIVDFYKDTVRVPNGNVVECCFDKVFRHINIYFLIAESYRGTDRNKPVQVFRVISCFFLYSWLYLFLGGFLAGVFVINIWRNLFLQDMELLNPSHKAKTDTAYVPT